MPSGELSLDSTQLPESKDWENGEEYDIIVHVKQLSTGKFQILSAESPSDVENINSDEYTKERLNLIEQKAKNY